MINKVFLIGRAGKDPVVKHFDNGGAIAEFTLATNDNYKDKDGNWVDVTDWHNVKTLNKFLTEKAEKYVKKGSLLFIEGKLKTRSYDDKDGNKKFITEVVVDKFNILDKKADSSSSAQPSAEGNNSNNSANTGADDDLPF